VVDTLSGRVSDARKVIEKHRVMIARQHQQISNLKDDRAYLRAEVEYRDKVIAALRDTVRDREAELMMLRDASDARVHHMPRRVLAQNASVWDELSAGDGISGVPMPTVVDFTIIDMILPNYEVDRQPA
jgi:chromosome segregation ATPase